MGGLSGGNQQKALLARLLELKPRVLFLDEPTRGIDIGAKSDIYRVIDAMAKQGIAVVVISSESWGSASMPSVAMQTRLGSRESLSGLMFSGENQKSRHDS